MQDCGQPDFHAGLGTSEHLEDALARGYLEAAKVEEAIAEYDVHRKCFQAWPWRISIGGSLWAQCALC